MKIEEGMYGKRIRMQMIYNGKATPKLKSGCYEMHAVSCRILFLLYLKSERWVTNNKQSTEVAGLYILQ